ncbi:MAG TPA: type II toxin-antitoxin system HicA family toxin [Puia sp.]|nr:type II toxin-antitoxin system HicA family toxin [Puia sp.]
MGKYRPLPTKCWEGFLFHYGFNYSRTSGSHDIWTKKGKRSIPVWGDEKEVPAMHMKTGCATIGCSMEDLYAWAAKNC